MTDEDRRSIQHGLNTLARLAHEKAVANGWYSGGERNVGEVLMLIVTEAAEAMEDYREGYVMDEVRYGENNKPEGFGIEIADMVIRSADLCGSRGLRLGDLVVQKMDFNGRRGFRHGGKLA